QFHKNMFVLRRQGTAIEMLRYESSTIAAKFRTHVRSRSQVLDASSQSDSVFRLDANACPSGFDYFPAFPGDAEDDWPLHCHALKDLRGNHPLEKLRFSKENDADARSFPQGRH